MRAVDRVEVDGLAPITSEAVPHQSDRREGSADFTGSASASNTDGKLFSSV
jgi:hypothetical protein